MANHPHQTETEGSAYIGHNGGPPLNQALIRDPQAAEILGVSQAWLRQTRMKGRSDGPPFVRVGKRMVRYKICTLFEWAEQRRNAPRSAPGPRHSRRFPVRDEAAPATSKTTGRGKRRVVRRPSDATDATDATAAPARERIERVPRRRELKGHRR